MSVGIYKAKRNFSAELEESDLAKQERESKTKIHFSTELYLVTSIWKPGYVFQMQTLFLSQAQMEGCCDQKFLHVNLLVRGTMGQLR